MKQFKQIFYLAATGIVLVSGCSVKNNMLNNNYTVSPNPLEVKGDTVTITISATIPAKSINPKANIQFQPYLKTPKGEIPLKAITVGGESVTDKVDFKVSSKTGGNVTYTDKVAYTPDMIRSTLYPDFAVKAGTDYTPVEKAKESKVLAEGIVTTPYLLKLNGNKNVMIFEQTTAANPDEKKSVYIYFDQNKAKFNPTRKQGAQDNKKQINDLKQILKGSKDWKVKGISINAYASPDGELSLNENLTKQRSESTFSYFKKELKKLGFTQVNDETFKKGYTTSEDWAGYEKAVEASNHPGKTAALAVVRNKGISDADREIQLRDNNKAFWDATKKAILPTLRKSEIVVTGVKPEMTDEQLKTKTNDLASLTDVEMLRLAKLTEENAGKQQIFTAMITKYPEDWRGYNNLGAAQIEAGNIDSGLLTLHNGYDKFNDQATILANIGNAHLMKGDFAKATDFLKQAASKGANTNYGQGMLNIKKGNYSEAVNALGQSGNKDFNFALAQFLNGNIDAAKSTIDNMSPEAMSWECYYLRAIIGARTSNQDLISANLTKAVQMEAGVREHAKNDVEFIKFWGNPIFEGAIR